MAKTPLKKKSVKQRQREINIKRANAPGRHANLKRAAENRARIKSGKKSLGQLPVSQQNITRRKPDPVDRPPREDVQSRKAIAAQDQRQLQAEGSFQGPQQQPTPTLPTPGETEDEAFLRQQVDDFERNEAIVNQNMVNTDLVAGIGTEAQTEEPETPENFGRDVAIGVGVGGASIAAGTFVVAGTTAGALALQTGSLAIPNVAKIAGGETIKQMERRILTGIAKPAPMTTKVMKKSLTWISRLVKNKRNSVALIGLISSTAGFWGLGEWGKAEGLEGLGFQHEKAIREQNEVLKQEIEEIMDDATDEKTWETISAFLPLIQIPITYKRIQIKIASSRAQRKNNEALDKRIKEGKPSATEQLKRDEESAYYEGIRERNKEIKQQERIEDEKYYSQFR